MMLAQNKYKSKIEDRSWNAPDEATEKIIALEAQVKSLTQKVTQAKKQSTKSGEPNKEGKGKMRGRNPKGRFQKPDWMLRPPAEGKPNMKWVDGKQYWWCPKHKSWGLHKPADCKGRGIKTNKDQPKDAKDEEGKALKLVEALANFAELEENGNEHE
jgi:hypothetical protein